MVMVNVVTIAAYRLRPPGAACYISSNELSELSQWQCTATMTAP